MVKKKQAFVYKVKILPRSQRGVPQDQPLDPFFFFEIVFIYSLIHSFTH